MKTSLHGSTTILYSLEIGIEAAGVAGFQGVELWYSNLDKYLDIYGKEALRDLLSQYDLEAVTICPFGGWVFCSDNEFKKKIENTEKYFKIANYLDPHPHFFVTGDAFENRVRNECVKAHASRLLKLADIGREYGVKIALENYSPDGSLYSMGNTVDVVNLVNDDYLGVIFDIFWSYKAGEDVSCVPRNISINKIFGVHISDCEDSPELADNSRSRLYPGLGSLPIIDLLKDLKELGYDGYLTAEHFSKELYKLNPKDMAKDFFKSLKNVMSEADV